MTESASVPGFRYNASLAGDVERRWQELWRAQGTFNAPNPVGPLAGDVPVDKLFVLDMFPYPSGAGLHVGHPLGYIATDVYARFHRMQGHNVLHTLGYDAFGLPAEQYAVQTGTHPRTTTEHNIKTMQGQLDRLGLGHDRRRVLATTDTDFYHWTQWIFLTIYNSWYDTEQNKARPISELEVPADLSADDRRAFVDSRRLVYRSDSLVNWCPGLGTVLANEEVTADGRSERGNFPVFRKHLQQWMMRITAYSDRLIDDLEFLDWPDKVKAMQRNWIGRSRGAQVTFAADGHELEVFTTRPDTLFGATYVVLAPEHPLVDTLTAASYPEGVDSRWTFNAATPAEAVASYRKAIAAKSDLERQENKEKTGVFLGEYAVNPVNGHKVPIFVADYVLMGYGTGAIMAVPGHDTRDHDFASTFGLDVVEVISAEGGGAEHRSEGRARSESAELPYLGDGTLVNSDYLDGLSVDEAKAKVIAQLEADGVGQGKIQYKLRDWLFARQRYWGEPFPIVYDADGNPIALPDSMLPVELPQVEDYAPVSFDPNDADSEPSPPLGKAKDWVHVELDLGDGLKSYTRDTNVMPQWAGSSWYQLRYIDPTNPDQFCAPENEAYWVGPRGANDPGGVDLYVGGVEHAVLHLLYARFWHKVLFDLGYVSSWEPFRRLFNQGYIQAFAFTDARGVYVPAAEVTEDGGKFLYHAEAVNREYGKMGKSLKNAVAPDEIAEEYGADTLRFYEMSMGPLDASRPWATKDVVGAHRFLQRLWRVVVNEETGEVRVTDDQPDDATMRLLHRTIDGVTGDYAGLRDNTAGAKLIELTNHLTKQFPDGAPRAVAEPLVLMLAPMAPHIAEELWFRLGQDKSLAHGPWPVADPQWLTVDTVEYPIQVNGKVRSRISVPADADPAAVQAAALADDKIVTLLDGKEPRKIIVVPRKMVNVVL